MFINNLIRTYLAKFKTNLDDFKPIRITAYSKEILSASLYIVRPFGLAPFSFSNKNDLSISIFGCIYSVIFLISFMTISILGMVLELQNPASYDLCVNLICLGTGIACVVIGLVVLIIKRSRFLQLAKYLSQVDEILLMGDATSARRFIQFVIIVLTSGLAFIYGYSQYIEIAVLPPLNKLLLISMFIGMIVAFIIVLHYGLSAYGISLRIIKLNRMISELMKLDRVKRDVSIPKLHRVLSANFIMDLNDVHDKLCKATVLFSEVFGLPILALMLNIITTSIKSSYFVITSMLDSSDVHLIVHNCMHCVYNFVRLLLIIEPAHRLCYQFQQFRSLIAALSFLDLENYTKQKILSLMNILMLSPVPSFCPCGMFIMQRGVLLTVLASMATYLIIVLDYHFANN